MANSFFLRIRGRVLGPFDPEKLRTLASRGQFGRMHEVSEDGVSWVRASQYPELFRAEDKISPRTEYSISEPVAVQAEQMIPVAAGIAAQPAAVVDSVPQANWHYAHNGMQFGPVSFTQLKTMLADGRLPPDETVWTNGMPEWLPASEIDGLAVRSPLTNKAGATLSDGVVSQLRDTRPWIIFFAVLSTLSTLCSVVGGVFLLIMAAKTSRTIGPLLAGQSIGSLVTALLSGISTAMLFSFAGKCRDFSYHRSEHTLQAALASLKTLVVYWGVLTIIAIVLAIIIVIYALVLA